LQQEIIVANQVMAFAVTIMLGIFIGFAYDVLRALRRLLHPSRRALFFWDLFFWLAITLTVFTALLASNWGEVRAYVMIGLGLGGTFYALFLTGTCYRLINFIFRVIIRLFYIITYPVIRPLRWVLSQLLRAKKSFTGRVRTQSAALQKKLKEKIVKKRRN
jgi:spore cortex biosynthesis protein YabQ